MWPFATYKDLLFLDVNQDGYGVSTTSAPGAYTRAHQGVWKAGMPVKTLTPQRHTRRTHDHPTKCGDA